jgi:hypothetical protein
VRAGAGSSFHAYALLAYPAIGLWLGHAYPALPLFGVTPCPVTIFTFGCLLFSNTPVPWSVFAIPVLWSLIGGSAAFLLFTIPIRVFASLVNWAATAMIANWFLGSYAALAVETPQA